MPTYIKPLDASSPELQEYVSRARDRMGFVPNSMLTMANKPEFLQAVLPMLFYMSSPTFSIDADLREMIAFMVSYGSGCRYCQAHSIHGAERFGVPANKIENLWRYAESDLYSDAEKAALDFAFVAGQQPSGATHAHFDALATHFSKEQIVDITGMCAIYGFLNRWNDTVATQLEDEPANYTSDAISDSDWERGKHM